MHYYFDKIIQANKTDLSLRVYVEASHVLYLHAGLNAHDCYVAAGMREFVMHG